MRKVILYIATSIDNYIAKKDGSVDWLFSDQDYGYQKFERSVDTVIMGGTTYRQVLSFGEEYPYAHKISYVITRDVSYQSTEDVKFIHHDVIDHIRELKEKPGKDIWLIGGSEINTIFLINDLIDELWIYQHPVILGEGIPLFQESNATTWFKLHDLEEFDTGMLKMVYIRK
jgi:dihydrofolate reductase